MGVRKWFIIFLIALLFGYLISSLEMRVEASSFENQPGLTFSPNKKAFTTDAGRTDWEWYEYGTVVDTGISAKLRGTKTGEHYYKKEVTGIVNIGKWEVRHMRGKCIHDNYPQDFYGVSFGTRRCWQSYFSGWNAYCADCNEKLSGLLFYMSKETAKGFGQIDLDTAYYYTCPHCSNLEQGWELPSHMCKDISWNRYYVSYDANQGNGYMPKSVHMYNNSTAYEGKEVTPQTTLNLNTFTRRGYTFAGWNTKADGSGESYEEGAEIYNLSSQEGGEIRLYAQWEKCNSGLRIDPAGGTYGGSKEPVIIEGGFGDQYALNSKELVSPSGVTVHFETKGGEKLPDRTGETILREWQLSSPFYGNVDGNNYQFGDVDGAVDSVKAIYENVAIVLPPAKKENYTFGGWYLDEECTKPVGGAGSEFLPGKEVTLYAGWVDLELTSKDNYVVNGGKGAVDLAWSQQDNNNKVYEVYQKREEQEWVQVSSAGQKEVSYETDYSADYIGKSTTYTIPFTGFYTLTLCGAQGGDYLSMKGGKGGKVQATIFLNKGEVLNCIMGGSNGYHGGGAAEKYAGGGGYSEVSSNMKGLLLIAGGGGGASSTENGRAGGSLAGLIEGKTGESGVCGGGGGYQGGRAGVAQIHTHVTDCKHEHVGTASTYGGCYTVAAICNNTSFQKKEVSSSFYYGNRCWDNGQWVHCFCVRCGSDDCSGHRDYKYEYICEKCGKEYASRPDVCTSVSGYKTACGRDESYVCGMKEGEILRSDPAYGGSNYINTEYCFQYTQEAGVNSGNGSLVIASERIGMLDVQQLQGVEATDMSAPDAIDASTVKKTAIGENEIRISFGAPKDNGTTYYHQVKSYSKSKNQWLCTSNQTVNTLTSGVTGYFYVWDKNADTKVDSDDSFLRQTGDSPFMTGKITEEKQFIHIAAVDKAGNIGNTVHIGVSTKEVIYWPVRTEKIAVTESINLSKTSQEDCYYVKADGTTPIELSFEGILCGTAGVNYQIEDMSFCMLQEAGRQTGQLTTVVPKQSSVTAGTFTYPMQKLLKKVSGDIGVLDDGYTVAKRYNQCKNVELIQKFAIPSSLHGQRIRVTPKASATYGKTVTYSDEGEDLLHGVYLIADGKGPEIQGLETLAGLDYIDFSEEEERKISLQAQDYESGLSIFYVEIYNVENAMTERYEASSEGKIEFTISKDNMLYNGEFSVIVYATDKVGNETVVSTKLLGVGLSAHVERVLEPHTDPFKSGESGIIYIQTVGYVERVEVSFPQEFAEQGSDYNQVFVYENPNYLQSEEIEFMVPLTVLYGSKTIQVKAYKAGTQLEQEPQILTIEVKGSVLDELRTRLR